MIKTDKVIKITLIESHSMSKREDWGTPTELKFTGQKKNLNIKNHILKIKDKEDSKIKNLKIKIIDNTKVIIMIKNKIC